MTARQIEAGRIAITRHMKRSGRIWIRVFPDKPFTKKPPETRMGKGKGAPEGWVVVVKPGRILYEMEGVPEGRRARRFGSPRTSSPSRTRFVTRGEVQMMKDAKVREMAIGGARNAGAGAEGAALPAAALRKRHRPARERHKLRDTRRDIARLETILERARTPLGNCGVSL